MINIGAVLVIELWMFIEDFKQVWLEVASLVQDHLRAGLYLLGVFALQFQPRLKLDNPWLDVFLVIVILLMNSLDLSVKPGNFCTEIFLQLIVFILQLDDSETSLISLAGLVGQQSINISDTFVWTFNQLLIFLLKDVLFWLAQGNLLLN